MIVTPLIMVGITCAARIAASFAWYEEVDVAGILVLYLGMYILVEALAGICYLGSCFFDQSGKAMAFGGGITVWCFIASLLGMFGSEDMVSMGFVWKLAVLAAIAIVCYAAEDFPAPSLSARKKNTNPKPVRIWPMPATPLMAALAPEERAVPSTWVMPRTASMMAVRGTPIL